MSRTLILTVALASVLSVPVWAQSTTIPAPATVAAVLAPTEGAVVLTSEEAGNWIDKPVYSSDGKNIGEVAAFARGTNNEVSELHADIGGYFGMGETRVRLMPEQFKLTGDRVTIDMTAEKAKNLPRVQ